MAGNNPKAVLSPAIFLDRDGTIIRETNYLRHPSQIQLLPTAIPALQRLQNHFQLVLVTNQAGIARGYLDEEMLRCIHNRLEEELAMANIHLARIYYCPHHPQAGMSPYQQDCLCRKPKPGMLLTAASDLHIDLTTSYTIGDKLSDIEAGRQAGTHTGLVRTGYGLEHESLIAHGSTNPDFVGDHLSDVADWILDSLTTVL
ncbi:MAG: HAD family hydrolase [Firmicutes bacterium]|nr:HAD family hydrolase [Bacillota bacterium]